MELVNVQTLRKVTEVNIFGKNQDLVESSFQFSPIKVLVCQVKPNHYDLTNKSKFIFKWFGEFLLNKQIWLSVKISDKNVKFVPMESKIQDCQHILSVDCTSDGQYLIICYTTSKLLDFENGHVILTSVAFDSSFEIKSSVSLNSVLRD